MTRKLLGWALLAMAVLVVPLVRAQQDDGPILRPKTTVTKRAGSRAAARRRARARAAAARRAQVKRAAATGTEGMDADATPTGIPTASPSGTSSGASAGTSLAASSGASLGIGSSGTAGPGLSGPTLLVLCDLVCDWKLDGRNMGRIEAGGSAKQKIDPGQHTVIAVTQDGLDEMRRTAVAEKSGLLAVSLELEPDSGRETYRYLIGNGRHLSRTAGKRSIRCGKGG